MEEITAKRAPTQELQGYRAAAHALLMSDLASSPRCLHAQNPAPVFAENGMSSPEDTAPLSTDLWL